MFGRSRVTAAALLALAVVTAGCGGKPQADNSPSPPGINLSLLTGLHAVELARAQVPEATGLARVSLSFPRDGGRAEYWSVVLADPTVPEGYRRVDLQGSEVVDLAPYTLTPQETAGSFSFDQLKVDTDKAEMIVAEMDWTDGARVTQPPVVLDALSSQHPEAVRGRPAWQIVVIRGDALVGAIYISTLDGSVLFEARG